MLEKAKTILMDNGLQVEKFDKLNCFYILHFYMKCSMRIMHWILYNNLTLFSSHCFINQIWIIVAMQ